MSAVLAIVSKAEFKELRTSDGLPPRLGVKLDIDRYHSQHPALDALAGGGALFLVTVLPGDVLWLVAMLGAVKRHKGSWKSQGTMMPVVDLTPVCEHLGIPRGDGKLAMRLQTPRVLDDRQWAILALDKAHAGQFIEAMYAYAGIREKTARKTLETFLDQQGWQPSDFSIELWDVYEGGRTKPRFEFWVQNAGDGMLFEYGRATSPHSIGSTQHSFESHGADDPETLALVDALQAAAEKSGAV